MKRNNQILGGITLLIIIMFCCGCSNVNQQMNEPYIPLGTNEVSANGYVPLGSNNVNVDASLPLTRQICDWTGLISSSIIKEQSEEGYVYTGKISTLVCPNMLVFKHQSLFK